MYTISLEILKKLVDIYNLLNQIEVKGIANLQFLHNSLYNLQKIIEEINEQQPKPKEPEEGIIINNTKKEAK